MKCPVCEEEDRESEVTPIYDYASGVMFSKTPPKQDTHYKCSNGHEWTIETIISGT